MNPPPKPNPSSNSQPQPPPPPSSSSASPPPPPPPPHHPVQVPSSLPSSSSAAPQYPPPPPPPHPPAPAPAPALAPSASESTAAATAAAETHLGPSKYPLDTFSWTELEEKFIARMNDFGQEERNIQEEFGNWVAVFTAWASVTSIWEEERGYKRLRTRISWVQNAEKNLEEKRLHYVTAIKAFENVVALLNGF